MPPISTVRCIPGKVSQLRKAAGLNQSVLAKRADIDVKTLRKIEKGEPASPEKVYAIVELLGASQSDVITEDRATYRASAKYVHRLRSTMEPARADNWDKVERTTALVPFDSGKVDRVAQKNRAWGVVGIPYGELTRDEISYPMRSIEMILNDHDRDSSRVDRSRSLDEVFEALDAQRRIDEGLQLLEAEDIKLFYGVVPDFPMRESGLWLPCTLAVLVFAPDSESLVELVYDALEDDLPF